MGNSLGERDLGLVAGGGRLTSLRLASGSYHQAWNHNIGNPPPSAPKGDHPGTGRFTGRGARSCVPQDWGCARICKLIVKL